MYNKYIINKKENMKKQSSVVNFVLIIVVIGLSVMSAVLYKQKTDIKNDPDYKEYQKIANNKEDLKKFKEYKDRKAKLSENDKLIAEVAKLITLPKNEKPFIGTYDSKTALKNNPFFKDAKDGDKYLIFSESGKAYIYRSNKNEKKLVNVGPIAITSNAKVKKTEEKTEN